MRSHDSKSNFEGINSWVGFLVSFLARFLYHFKPKMKGMKCGVLSQENRLERKLTRSLNGSNKALIPCWSLVWFWVHLAKSVVHKVLVLCTTFNSVFGLMFR